MKKNLFLFIVVPAFITGCSGNKPLKQETVSADSTNWQTEAVEQAEVHNIIKLPAQLAAFEEVSIFPKVNGYVKSVQVDVGSKVTKGQWLMELEAPELEQATLEAKEKYARAKADYLIDKEKYNRLKEASATEGAISPLDLSTVRAKMEADSALGNAEKNNWEMKQTIQQYLHVTAPFSGIITERNVHPGALVSAESKDNRPMLELKQVDHLRLQVDVPEAVSGGLKLNDTLGFFTSAFPGREIKGTIARKSMNINPQFRSERIEIDVYNKSGDLAPGMYADVLIQSHGNVHGFAVPGSCIVTSTERKYVIVIRNGKTEKVDVTTGNVGTKKTEVFGKLKAGEMVLTNADDGIKEGISIR